MKKIIILLSFLIPCLVYGQALDSLYLKTGKIVTGNFTFSEDKSFVFSNNDATKELYASTAERFVKKGKSYLPVELFIDGTSKIFFAEKVFVGEISILEFDALKAATKQDYNTNKLKYFLLRNGKTTLVSRQGLDAFYKVYLGDCYKSKDNKNLDNRYNSIVDVLNNYYKCKNPNKKIITKRKYVEGYAFGFSTGFGSMKVRPSILERQQSGEILDYFRNADIKGNNQIFIPYFKLDLIKNCSIYLQGFFQTQKVASQDTFYVASYTEQVYLPGIIDPFFNTNVISYNADYNINMLGIAALIEQNFNIGKLKVGGAFGFSVSKTAKYIDYSTIYTESTVPSKKSVAKVRLFDFSDNAGFNVTYGFNYRIKVEYPIAKRISICTSLDYMRSITKATHISVGIQGGYSTAFIGGSLGLNYYFYDQK